METMVRVPVTAHIKNGVIRFSGLPKNVVIGSAHFIDQARLHLGLKAATRTLEVYGHNASRGSPLRIDPRHAKNWPDFHGQPDRLAPVDGLDPSVIGFDGQLYQGVASMQYQTGGLTYVASGNVGLANGLPRNTFITEIMLTADPFDTIGDGTNAATIVEDAQDKLLQGLTIAGGPTYYSHNNLILAGKHLGNLNKYLYSGAIVRDNISTSSSATAVSNYESWRLHFGALNDYMPFDISAGIPAELETTLNLSILFPSTSLLATTSTYKVLQTTTIVRVLVIGVNGMPAQYLQDCPIPDFRTDIISSPVTNQTLSLLGGRFLKRTTIVNMAANASNNSARNDSNLTDMSITLLKPTTIKVLDTVRIQTLKALLQAHGGRWSAVDANGTIAVAAAGHVGVYVIDWRKITGNPYGLDLTNFSNTDAQLGWTVGTTTGQINAYHEYYAVRNVNTLAAMRAWQGRYAFQPV